MKPYHINLWFLKSLCTTMANYFSGIPTKFADQTKKIITAGYYASNSQNSLREPPWNVNGIHPLQKSALIICNCNYMR